MVLPVPLEVLATSNMGLVRNGELPTQLRVAEERRSLPFGDTFVIYHVSPSDSGSFDLNVEPFSVGEGGSCVGPYRWQFFGGCRDGTKDPLMFGVGGRPEGHGGAYVTHAFSMYQTASTMPSALPYEEAPFADYLARRREVTGREFITTDEQAAWRVELDRQFREAMSRSSHNESKSTLPEKPKRRGILSWLRRM